MTITILKSEIAEALKRESSLISKGAFSNNGSSLYDVLLIDEREMSALEGAYQDALSAIITLTREHLASDPRLSEESSVLSLRKSDPELADAIKRDICSYITKTMMAQWLNTVYPAQSQMYEKSALSVLRNLNLKLYTKNPPMR